MKTVQNPEDGIVEKTQEKKIRVGPNEFQNLVFSNSMGFSPKRVPFEERE